MPWIHDNAVFVVDTPSSMSSKRYKLWESRDMINLTVSTTYTRTVLNLDQLQYPPTIFLVGIMILTPPPPSLFHQDWKIESMTCKEVQWTCLLWMGVS